MKIGIPTLVELSSIEDHARLCHELHFDFVEINLSFPQFQVHLLNAEEMQEMAEKYHIGYTFHLDENMDIASFNPDIADVYLHTTLDAIRLAKQVHAPVLNMHLINGVYITLPEKRIFMYEKYEDDYLKNVIAFRDAFEKEIGNENIHVCVENCAGFLPFHIHAIETLFQSPAFGLTLDVGHNHATHHTDEPFILKNQNRLKHMHMHDAREKKDHLALGDGEVDISKYYNLAQQNDCTVVFETKTIAALKQSSEWLRIHK